jgi:4-amino-4-deoxy-L-arabinose transferase-like glycosyltransferase
MPIEPLVASVFGVSRRWWPEALLAILACAVFMGCLGSVEIWGKREQRASAEAIDTVDHNHWLIAQIQGRPRLEKPPLPRWSIAALMKITGRRDETVVRLPGALAGVLTVALVFALGRSMGGRPLGLASAFVLCSMGFFVGEMRQASNDGFLVLFTTAALYAAYRRLHDSLGNWCVENKPSTAILALRSPGARGWSLVFHTALGLGFLTKGPVIGLLVGVAIIPYLAFSRRLLWGLHRLCETWGLMILGALALSWPAAVLLQVPNALQVWSLEMSEKTGLSHILEHRWHSPLVGQWPGLVLPWTLIGVVAVFLPLRSAAARSIKDRAMTRDGRSIGAPRPDTIWFAWWWAVGNLVVFCSWVVAKPNYYTPCLPGMALLIGATWLHLARIARGQGTEALAARAILQAQWVAMFVAAALAPVVVREWLPSALWPWSVAIALALVGSVAVSVHAWRRGADALPLAPLATACVLGVLIAYGIIAPVENELRSHRVLAHKLHQLVPSGVRTLNFFNEIDEGLWFYLNGLELTPVPGTHPRYNTAYDLAHSYLTERLPFETLSDLEAKRQARDKQALIDWVTQCDPSTSFLVIRGSLYDGLAGDLAARVVPVFRETGMKRNEMVLLQVADRRAPAATPISLSPAPQSSTGLPHPLRR